MESIQRVFSKDTSPVLGAADLRQIVRAAFRLAGICAARRHRYSDSLGRLFHRVAKPDQLAAASLDRR